MSTVERLCAVLAAIVWMAAAGAHGQGQQCGRVLRAVVIDGDTVPVIDLEAAHVQQRWNARNRRQAERYDRLTRNVVKVYPYARITGELLREYEHDLATIRREGDQELYLKLAEAELRAEFEAELKDLTISQGKVLIKLIDRQTGRTSFDLVRQLRGSFTALVWQGMARMFGHDLRSTYDPVGDDRLIEVVVQRIERGELAVADRGPRTAKAQARLEKRKARLYKRYGLQPGEASNR